MKHTTKKNYQRDNSTVVILNGKIIKAFFFLMSNLMRKMLKINSSN